MLFKIRKLSDLLKTCWITFKAKSQRLSLSKSHPNIRNQNCEEEKDEMKIFMKVKRKMNIKINMKMKIKMIIKIIFFYYITIHQMVLRLEMCILEEDIKSKKVLLIAPIA